MSNRPNNDTPDDFHSEVKLDGQLDNASDLVQKSAPVVRSDTSRILLTVATRGWKKRQFDIKAAVVSSQMNTKLYTADEPKGYETGEGNLCLLNIALYGPVQSAYLWFEEIKGTLKQYGLTQSRHDDALYYNPAAEL